MVVLYGMTNIVQFLLDIDDLLGTHAILYGYILWQFINTRVLRTSDMRKCMSK